ncbi:hypothetical protein QVD17_00222 [Tagetes erecta]|uniref:Uncharacterized protein n=1 Tax=Tagetes erecta TaxID=13708 RepID=A0AAD8P6T4_TARER|nr:hypothetical protein QVD17_00222 [Tagetes erecta]
MLQKGGTLILIDDKPKSPAEVDRPTIYRCNKCYGFNLPVQNHSGVVSLTLFEREAKKLLNVSAKDLIESSRSKDFIGSSQSKDVIQTYKKVNQMALSFWYLNWRRFAICLGIIKSSKITKDPPSEYSNLNLDSSDEGKVVDLADKVVGDSNSAFFHSFLKCQNHCNRSDSIKDVNGMRAKGYVFYGDDKAPGPDGYTSVFFKKTWSITRKDVSCAIQDFFNRGKLLQELNHTLIALIPKVTTPSGITNFKQREQSGMYLGFMD